MDATDQQVPNANDQWILAKIAKEKLKLTSAEHAVGFAAAKKADDAALAAAVAARQKRKAKTAVAGAAVRTAAARNPKAKKLTPYAERHTAMANALRLEVRHSCLEALGPEDRKVWQQAIALLMGLRIRNGLFTERLTAAVGVALREGGEKRKCKDCGMKVGGGAACLGGRAGGGGEGGVYN